jgi:hypothetical protein
LSLLAKKMIDFELGLLLNLTLKDQFGD